jgi:hypothetical protein
METEKRGGQRKNSGRKPLTNEKSLYFRLQSPDGTFKRQTIRVNIKTKLEDVLKKLICLKSKKK